MAQGLLFTRGRYKVGTLPTKLWLNRALKFNKVINKTGQVVSVRPLNAGLSEPPPQFFWTVYLNLFQPVGRLCPLLLQLFSFPPFLGFFLRPCIKWAARPAPTHPKFWCARRDILSLFQVYDEKPQQAQWKLFEYGEAKITKRIMSVFVCTVSKALK